MRLHPKHGLNPTIPTCFFCGKRKNEIVLLGASSKAITGQDEAPMNGPVFDKTPCDECKGYMDQGIIIVTVRDGETSQNPYRTGGFYVLKQEACERMFRDVDLSGRFLFIEDSVARRIGLDKH